MSEQFFANKPIPSRFWEIAADLYARNMLEHPAVALFDDENDVHVIADLSHGSSEFRNRLMEQCASMSVSYAVFMAKVFYKFEPMPDGTKPFPDFAALTLVATEPNGARVVQTSRLYEDEEYIQLGEPTVGHMPTAVIVDEIFVPQLTIH